MIYHPFWLPKGNIEKRIYNCDVLRDLVPFVQFKKCENTHESVTFSKTCNLSKSNTPP